MPVKSCFVLLLLLLCSFSAALAQEEYKNKAFLSTMFMVNLTDARSNNETGIYFLQGGFGWRNKKHNWHEAEISNFGISKYEYGHAGLLGLRYQFSLMPFKKLQQARVQPFIGFGGTNFIHYDNFKGQNIVIQNLYERRHLRNFTTAYISPGADIQLGKRFYTTVQIPVDLAQIEFVKTSHRNNQADEINTFSDTEVLLLPFYQFNMRLSFGYKF